MISNNHQSFEIANLQIANLPTVLKEGMEAFTTDVEQRTFLYSAITVLSGLCVNVKGEYRRQTVRPNLYLFVIAPPASGKSALNYARKLVYKVHRKITDESQAQIEEYRKIKERIGNNRQAIMELTKPLRKVVLIPANVSSARLLEHLAANKGTTPSIIAESEIDSLTIAMKSEWGNFSDILRKAFHNEPTDSSRKTNDEYFELTEPQLSIALAGTPNQFRKIITNAEDGFFSRFLVYSFSNPVEWSSVAPGDGSVNLDELFNRLSEEISRQYEYMKDRVIKVQLTPQQWDRIDQFGREQMRLSKEANETNTTDLIFRHGLMIYKISMVLTVLREMETEDLHDRLICEDHDFNLSLLLVVASLENGLELLPTLPARSVSRSTANKQAFLEKLPSEFERREAVPIAWALSIGTRTADEFLRKFSENGVLISVGHGRYRKP